MACFARAAFIAAILLAVAAPQLSHAVVMDGTVGVEGRYIRITKLTPTNSGDNNRFHIGEVEAFANGVTPAAGLDNANDLALSGLGAVGSTISGNVQHGAESNLVSGVVNTAGSTWSRQNPLPVIAQVDLGSVQDLGEVRIWQRGDGCCQQRQKDFSVSVLADNGGSPGAVLFEQSFSGQTPTNSFTAFSTMNKIIDPGNVGVVGMDVLTGGLDARFIRVTKTSNTVNPGDANRLHIGEVEAFDVGVAPTAGLDGANDLALSNRGAVGSTISGTPQHGADAALVNGALDTGSGTWSRQNPLPIIAQVDLGQTRDLERLRLWQRTDSCCQNRLEDFTVSVFADNGAGGLGQLLASFAHPNQVPTNSFAEFDLPDGYNIGGRDILNIDIDAATITNDLLKIGALGDGWLFVEDGATLNINLIGLANDIDGQTFQIIDAAGIIGSFSNVTFNNASIAGVDTSDLINGRITIQAVPEPATAALGLLGLGALMMRRRK